MQNISNGVKVSIAPVGVYAEQVGEAAVLEDQHHRAERRGEAQHVEQQRLDRHEHAAGHQEQQQERHRAR